MKVIVYEHVSGGGYCGQLIPPSFLAEGFAMLRSVVGDFKAAGHTVTVLLDDRLSRLNPPIGADFVVPVSYFNEPQRFLIDIAKINDATYVIAPESGKILQSLVALMEKTEKISLNCESETIAKVGNKAVLYEKLEKTGFLVPKTLVLENGTALQQELHKLSYPLIFKPVDGAGASGLSTVKEFSQVGKALLKIEGESTSKRFIVQEFFEGERVSVSLLSTGKKAMAVSLNKQNMVIAEPDELSSYQGGIVPFEHPREHDAFAVAKKVVELFPGLRGYVGVDLILTENAVFVVDVNPRLTTSFVGLHKVANFNVAEALINSVMSGKLPLKPEVQGVACFSKQEMRSPTNEGYRKALNVAGLLSPPFPLQGNTKSCALVMGYGKDCESACLGLEEAKKQLQDSGSRGEA
jgi:hypothetical protein